MLGDAAAAFLLHSETAASVRACDLLGPYRLLPVKLKKLKCEKLVTDNESIVCNKLFFQPVNG